MKKVRFIWQCFLISMCFMCLTGCGEDGKAKVYSEKSVDDTDVSKDKNYSSEQVSGDNEEIQTDGYVYVQLCGAVNTPGVYKLLSGTRVFEALEAAGGTTEEADTNAVNLARPVTDEMQIYIPTKEEASNSNGDYFWENTQDLTEGCTDSEEDSLININDAAREELMKLPGIGEAKADAIISYREENGGFSDISEIMNISGIKEAAFEKIKDLIKV